MSFVHRKDRAPASYSDVEVVRERHSGDDRFCSNDCRAGIRGFERVRREESPLDSQTSKFPGSQKYFREHCAVQSAGVGVA